MADLRVSPEQGQAKAIAAVPHAREQAPPHAGAMAAPRIVVYPPTETGGRRVRVDCTILGTAYSIHDLVAFLQEAGLQGWDELDVVQSDLIDWRGGGSDVWGR